MFKNFKKLFISKNIFRKNNKIKKIHKCNIIITKILLNNIVKIYNGKNYISLKITKNLLGYSIGNFINTKNIKSFINKK